MTEVADLIDDSQDVLLVDVQNTNVAEFIWLEIKEILFKLNEEYQYGNDVHSMKKVFNTLLIPAYDELDINYKISKSFKKVLSHTLQMLKNDPNHKFTHIMHLYETLKLHKVRKKASFVTLAIDISDEKYKVNTKRKIDSNDNVVKKCSKIDTNVLDQDRPIISKENKESDVILLDDVTDIEGEKENVSLTTKTINQVKNALFTSTPDVIHDISKDVCHTDNLVENENSLLIPRKTESFTNVNEHVDLEKKSQIEKIERKIGQYKEAIAVLEKQEVNDDTFASPYIISDKYKAQIVELYKELCRLTGTGSETKREIRLLANNSHSLGPVQRLQCFLNNRIESDVHPPFPDFNDVVNCVIISNQLDNLGWSQTQIISQATSIFTQCGRALQRRRQNREWRHLMDTAREEGMVVDDPAENDPELEARLQENRRIAMRKENKLIERFSMLQDVSRHRQVNNKANDALQNVCRNSTSTTKASSESFNKSTNKVITEQTPKGVNDNSVNDGNAIVKSEKVEDVIELLSHFGDNFTTTVKVIDEDPSLIIAISSDSSSEED